MSTSVVLLHEIPLTYNRVGNYSRVGNLPSSPSKTIESVYPCPVNKQLIISDKMKMDTFDV